MESRLLGKFIWVMGGAIALLLGSTSGAIAAETLRFRIGPLQHTLALEDLETFAETGKAPQSLGIYKSFLGSDMRRFLQGSLSIEPETATEFLDDLWRSPTGKIILDQMQLALPGSSTDDLQSALKTLASQEIEISALNLLRAYPAKKITVDLTAVAGLLFQANLPNLQSQILSPKITTELEVDTDVAALPATKIDPITSGQQLIRRQTLILQDYERDRTIPIDVYDSTGNKDQLVVLSHGFAANRQFLDYLATHLASHGYTVVTLDHPGSNIQALLDAGLSLDKLLPATEFLERPRDISFVVDELERLNELEQFQNQFVTDNITVIGHSFGGYTALALAGGVVDPAAIRTHCNQSNPLLRAPGDWLQCAAAELPYGRLALRDERVKQAIALNPIIGEVFGVDGLADVDIPTLILTSTNDAITPSLTHQLLPFQELGGEKYLVVANGATHMSVTDLSNRDSLLSQSTLVPEVMGAEAEPVRQMLQALSLSFLERHGDDGESYNQFLSPEYVQSLSSSKIKLRLTETISTELENFLSSLPQSQIRMVRQQKSNYSQKTMFSFWRSTERKTSLPSYPSGVLSHHLSPLFQTTRELQQIPTYYVARLGEVAAESQWN